MGELLFKNITKVYPGDVTAVEDFNLKIEDKEFIVLVGPSGCGKSTTLRMVAGLEDISGGELYIDDKLVNELPPKDRDIAMVFQNYALYPHMTVYENMAYGLKLRKMSKDEIDKKVKDAAKSIGIEMLLDRKPKALSGGQRQRVALGRAIVRNPKVFLMDEPLSNLDAKLRVQTRAEIIKLHKDLQTTFIYVTHDQTEAMTMGDRIVVMKDGLVQQVATPQELYNTPVNMFVAGFIGSPQMNFIEVDVTGSVENCILKFGEKSVGFPPGKASILEDKGYMGKKMMLGIRPEDFHSELAFLDASEDSIVDAHINLVEMMGSETYLYITVEGVKMVCRVNPRNQVKMGDTIKLALDKNMLYLFDSETELRII
nr:sn-glycerol-3-phosphate ABC transporter ATP-binding protein UgpC [Tissierella sp.]